MKVLLLLVISCLALHHGKGAPRKAVYKFVKCNPEGGKANCVTQQSPEMAWTPDLPRKLPASRALYLEEDKSPLSEDLPKTRELEESPLTLLTEDGSGGYEGSAAEDMADQPFDKAERDGSIESEIGSGESWREKGVDREDMSWPDHEGKPAEQELREDHLLKP